MRSQKSELAKQQTKANKIVIETDEFDEKICQFQWALLSQCEIRCLAGSWFESHKLVFSQYKVKK